MAIPEAWEGASAAVVAGQSIISQNMTAGEMTLYDEFQKKRKPLGFAPAPRIEVDDGKS